MSDNKIKFKRKATTGAPNSESGKKLESGEPFYNMADKHLYIGNNEADDIKDKKHIAQVTVTNDGEDCSVSVGEDANNKVYFDGLTFKAENNKISMDLSEIVLDGGAAGTDE